MSTQTQAQHCREYMQPILINIQETSALPKHIVKLVKNKPKTSEESGSGVNYQERTSSVASVRSLLDVRALDNSRFTLGKDCSPLVNGIAHDLATVVYKD
ncbi:hypothetical protein BofuT4_P059150.1 [Botrytis cinerea T4]|uniref:Uncharacterized protein n=1 Tax=Botryotinia fuckeliana (strain T4) TaxID=999810 RepID=G2XV15_BOTF4|nr:hypothetical protein BofuT4_P059150.1 [Botrytis cinerea T4]